jgi:proteic killer suppression protein
MPVPKNNFNDASIEDESSHFNNARVARERHDAGVAVLRRAGGRSASRQSPSRTVSVALPWVLLMITLAVHHASRYYPVMAVSYRCRDTEALANGQRVRRFASIETVARRKLRQLQIAGRLEDLRVPPGNRLEALKGDRAGQYSIGVNQQFRVCFRWTPSGARDFEIVDYH